MSEGIKLQLKPNLQAKLDEWSARTGRQADELVEEALAGYLDELSDIRTTLDTRYDELKTGRVQAIEAVDAMRMLEEKSKALRAKRNG